MYQILISYLYFFEFKKNIKLFLILILFFFSSFLRLLSREFFLKILAFYFYFFKNKKIIYEHNKIFSYSYVILIFFLFESSHPGVPSPAVAQPQFKLLLLRSFRPRRPWFVFSFFGRSRASHSFDRSASVPLGLW